MTYFYILYWPDRLKLIDSCIVLYKEDIQQNAHTNYKYFAAGLACRSLNVFQFDNVNTITILLGHRFNV